MNQYDKDTKLKPLAWEDIEAMRDDAHRMRVDYEAAFQSARDYGKSHIATATEIQMEHERHRRKKEELRKLYEEQARNVLLPSYLSNPSGLAGLSADDFFGHAPKRKKRKPSAPRPKKALLNMLGSLLDKDE